jgi:hypothetical protein
MSDLNVPLGIVFPYSKSATGSGKTSPAFIIRAEILRYAPVWLAAVPGFVPVSISLFRETEDAVGL